MSIETTPSNSSNANPTAPELIDPALLEAHSNGLQLGNDLAKAQQAGFSDARSAGATWGDAAKDIPIGIAQGARDFLYSATGLVNRINTGEGDAPLPSETRTTTGSVASALTQFALPFGTASKVVKAVGSAAEGLSYGSAILEDTGFAVPRLLKAALWGTEKATSGKLGTAAATGLSSFVGFDEHTERLSNVLQNVPLAGPAVFQFLASKEDDSWVTARFKTAIENAGMGLAADGLIGWVKGIRNAAKLAKAGDTTAASTLLDKTAVAVNENAKLASLVNDFKSTANLTDSQAEAVNKAWSNVIASTGSTLDEYLNKYTVKVVQGVEEAAPKAVQPVEQVGTLFQGDRGQVQFLSNTNAVISLFKGADISTVFHESFHVWRRFGLGEAAEKDLAESFGAQIGKDGKYVWTRPVEERAATAFETYLSDGITANAGQKEMFQSFKQWMTDVYKGVDDSPLSGGVHPQVRDVFERMLSDPEVAGGNAGTNVAGAGNSDGALVLSQGGKYGKFSIPDRRVEEFGEALKSATNAGDLDTAVSSTVKTWVNYNRNELTKDAEGVLKGAMSFIEDQFRAQQGEPISLEYAQKTAQKLAQEFDLGGGVANSLKDAGSAKGLGIRLIAYRNLLTGQAENVAKMAKDIAGGGGDVKAFTDALKPFLSLRYNTKAIETEAARTVSFGRVVSKASNAVQPKVNIDEMAQAIESTLGKGDDAARNLANRLAAGQQDVSRIGAALAVFESAGITKLRIANSMLKELWLNGILSGVKTFSTNVIGQAIQTVLVPGEKVLGGVLTRNGNAVREGMKMYYSLGDTLMDAARYISAGTEDGRNLVGKALASTKGDAPLFGHMTLEDSTARITAQGASDLLGVDPGGVIARTFDYAGKVVRYPSNVLNLTDSLVKEVNYRAWLKTKAFETAFEQGIKDPKEMASAIQSFMRTGYLENGAAALQEGIDYASKITFTQSLKPGGLGESLQHISNNVPGMWAVLPFVRTPSNILKTAWQYSPGLNLLNTEFRQSLAGASGKAAQAEAAGRLALSSSLLGGAMFAAANGRITGSGPIDPNERSILMNTGWKPFSFVTNNDDGTKTYTSYARIDPFATVLGMVADLHYYGKDIPDHQRLSAATAFGLATAKQITSKSFLQGLALFVDAAGGDDSKVDKLLKSYAGTLVPNVIAQNVTPLSGQEGSDFVQEAHNYAQAIYRRLPGYNNPKRNILGEAIPRSSGYDDIGSGLANALSPVAFSKSVNDPVRQEMANIGHGFSMPPKMYKSLNLTDYTGKGGNGQQTAWDRALELRSTVKIGGQTLAQSLNRLVTSNSYKSIPADAQDDGGTPLRAKEMQRVIGQYHAEAMSVMLKEFPQITAALKEKSQRSRGQLLLQALPK